jgi:hypothetical protein
MKWLLLAAATLAAVVAVILGLAATAPDTIAIARSITIRAPAPVVFGLIDDFHHWPLWAPQDREDATMRRTFDGHGEGAISAWTSKGDAGAGRMTIARSVPYSEIEVRVDFRAPFVAHNVNDFRIVPVPGGSQITWSMHGTNVFLMRIMGVFVSPDRLMGPHFEKGLEALKSAAESRSGQIR